MSRVTGCPTACGVCNRGRFCGAYPSISTIYYHGGHLGSSRLMSCENGYPVWEATYRPFGEEHNAQPTVNHYKFTGKERDSESKPDYFGAGYYSSSYGRFVSPDEFAGGAVDAFSSSDPLPPGRGSPDAR